MKHIGKSGNNDEESGKKPVGRAAFRQRSEQNPPSWQIRSELFPEPDRELQKMLSLFPKALQAARPLREKHRAKLPEDIRSLSRQLTEERSTLALPYWSSPASMSAYLHYFLPWNLLRLGRLFMGLELPDPARLEKPLLLDAGSGPLTLPMALWIAKPEWRKLPIRVLALDSSRQALETGKNIFAALAELAGEKAWTVEVVSAPVEKLAAGMEDCLKRGCKPWLLSSANTLNELASRSKTKHKGDAYETREPSPKANLYERLLDAWSPVWRQPDAVSLFVELGSRNGGNAIMNMRKAALNAGLHALAPCTHDGGCPLLDSGRNRSSYSSGWCHFTFSVRGAPEWLSKLSRESGLEKNSLSLSMLLLGQKAQKTQPGALPTRVLSQPFAAQGISGEARYGCECRGIGLMENAASLPSGCLTQAHASGRKDTKKGYEILEAEKGS